MAESYFADQTFKGVKSIQIGDFENCHFINCILPNSDLSDISFVECEFENCDFSSSKLYDTSFKSVFFIESKLVGLRFEECNEFLFSIDFRSCYLNLSSFYQMNPQGISFRECNLKEVDFTEAELAETLFEKCNLNSAIFKNTNLEKANFRSAYNFLIDPEINNIQKTKFSLMGLPGLLDKYDLEIE
ncbi:MAG: pentapeptide repeat-containing protein [Balneolaceae bacterium]|nr:pentapeptide repeat-containing protein [Balneolaceae bacterium]